MDSQERVSPCVQALSELISSSQSCIPLIFLPPEPQIMPPTMASHPGEDFPQSLGNWMLEYGWINSNPLARLGKNSKCRHQEGGSAATPTKQAAGYCSLAHRTSLLLDLRKALNTQQVQTTPQGQEGLLIHFYIHSTQYNNRHTGTTQ